MKVMQEISKAYIAGIIDGEGCIHGHVGNIHKGYSTGGAIDVRVTVEATSLTMIKTLQEFCDELGVSYSIYIGKMARRSTKPSHIIRITKRECVKNFLKALLPYLQVKRPEAEVVLEWIEKWGMDMRGTNSHKVRNIPTKEQREEFLFRLKELKYVA